MDTSAFHNAVGHEELSPAATAVGITEAVRAPNGIPAYKVRFSVRDQAIRYRYDGGTPTATTGHAAAAGETIELYGDENVRRLLFIAQTGTAEVTVTTEAP